MAKRLQREKNFIITDHALIRYIQRNKEEKVDISLLTEECINMYIEELRTSISKGHLIDLKEAKERFSCKKHKKNTVFSAWYNNDLRRAMVAIIVDGVVVTVLKEKSSVYERPLKLKRIFRD